MLIDRNTSLIKTVDNILSTVECEGLMRRIDAEHPSVAPIQTVFGPQIQTRIRNNERVMFDDSEMSAMIFSRLQAEAPELCHGRTLVSANERLRCYRYKPGMRFAPHSDGAFVRNPREQSYYTVLVYLNEGFEGGATAFLVRPEVKITPKRGMALLFQHPIVHEGQEVIRGTKYVLRTDLMYRL